MKVSIVTINYNNRDGLNKTIKSVVNQTTKDFEYIVIDGGSTDGSLDIIKTYSNRLNYWVSEPDRGVYHAMNKGIDVALGEYCIFMNSGDIFYDNTTLADIIPELDGSDVILGDTLESDGSIKFHKEEMTFKTLYNGSISHQSSFIKTSLLKKYHYDETLKIVSDWKFFLQTLIIDNCSYKGISQFISIYDVSGITYSNMDKFIEERTHVINKMFPYRIVQDIDELLKGVTWEDKLYLGIKKSKYHKLIYRLNVMFLKTFSFMKKSWISDFPNSI